MLSTARIIAVRRALYRGTVCCLLGGASLSAAAPERWAVCYSPGAEDADLAGYDLVVLDADHYPALAPLIERGTTRLAYLSLTQMGTGRAEFPQLTRTGVILDAHPVWAGAHYLDFRRPEWTRLVVDRLVPRALERGFNGLFLDTLDDAEFLERSNPVRYRGMRDAAVRLVRAIRHRHPRTILMVNRGYALMPQIASSIDIVLGESVAGSFDPVTKAYRRPSSSDVDWQVDQLERARAVNPRLKVFTLDYWDPSDREGVAALYREQRARGFVPYVSTPQLDRLVQEPR